MPLFFLRFHSFGNNTRMYNLIAWWGVNQQCFCCHIILVQQYHVKFKEKRKKLACHAARHRRGCSLSLLQLLHLSCSSAVLWGKKAGQIQWGNFRQNQGGSVRVESVNVKRNLGYKPAHKQWISALRTKLRPYLHLECPKTLITTIFSTKSTTLTLYKNPYQ